MKKILVPCDFSAPAQQAFKFAMDMAKASEGEVYVLNIIDLPILYETTFGIQPYFVDTNLIKEFKDDAHKKYDKLRSLFVHLTSPVSFHILNGPVTPLICDFIKDHEIDLVVMGTHGSSGLKEYFIGSNTEKVVRYSSVPVFSIRQAPDLMHVRKIVFPSSLVLDQHEFVEKVKALQEFFNAVLHVLLINTRLKFKPDREIKALLEEFVKHYKLNNYTLNWRSEEFEQDGIIHFADEINADMIAMGTHGRRGLTHFFSGSIAEDVMNRVACPIWTYKL